MDRTFRDLPSTSSPDERQAVQKAFPTMLESVDGNTLWFSRLPHDDPGVTTAYEVEYARWIPGDPVEALRAVLVFAGEQDVDRVSNALVEAIKTAGREILAD